MTHNVAPERWKVVAAFAAVYVIWGSTYLAIRFAVESIPPLFMAGVRFLLAGSILYGGLRLRGVAAPSPRFWLTTGIAGALLLGGNGAVTWAEQAITSGMAALLVALVPLWMVLMAWRTEGRRPGPATIAGLVIGFFGVVLLIGPGSLVASTPGWLSGALVAVGGSVLWAAGSIYSRRGGMPSNVLLSIAMQMIVGGGVLVLAGLLGGEGSRVAWSAISTRSFLAFVYLVVFGSLVGFSAYVWLLQVSSPERVGTYAYVNPMIAVVLGWALAGEILTLQMLLASSLIIGSVVLINLSQGRRKHPLPATGQSVIPRVEGTEPA